MKNFLSSKTFVIVGTLFTLVVGGIAGWLLGYQPSVSGEVHGLSGYYGSTSGVTSTVYEFQIKTACGYWLIALIMTFLVFLVCILIRQLCLKSSPAEKDKE